MPAISNAPGEKVAKSDEFEDFNPGEVKDNSERERLISQWVQSIVIKSPKLRSDVKGDIKVAFQAPGMTTARALCWQQPTAQNPNPWGHDAMVTQDIKLDSAGNGSFLFPADQFPNGPTTIRLLAHNPARQRDIRELQLFNLGGIVWNQGIPKTDPPAARGMKLAFADDFDGPLSISNDGKGARYCAHKPGGGDFSGWPFTGPEGSLNPFSQKGTFLRIRGFKPQGTEGSSGILASIAQDRTGFVAHAPCYFECRFIAQSAPGTWPAFWLCTTGKLGVKGCDETDIIEAYGGMGKGNPNGPDLYHCTTHFWDQLGPDGQKFNMPVPTHKTVDMAQLGGKSSWSTTLHTYAVKITHEETIYYCDDIEVLRHPTGPLAASQPHFFMVNYAIGGISGWKIDLEREGNATDMHVDYVRVYQG
jgi:hypothetical protein